VQYTCCVMKISLVSLDDRIYIHFMLNKNLYKITYEAYANEYLKSLKNNIAVALRYNVILYFIHDALISIMR
jgi:hypothetical protein